MNPTQRERYKRHILLPQVGEKGQQKLLESRVLVVGAGGLGSPLLQYLVAAGIGTIGIIDSDVVSLSNLQRQILYREDQLGKAKVEMARQSLKLLNEDVTIKTYAFDLDDDNVKEIMSEYDVVVGATDNFASRKCIDAESKRRKIPFVNGSIEAFEGQVSVFNYKGGPSYGDLFPDTPDETHMPLGVVGALPGIIGSIQACEVIKIILNEGNILSGKLLVYDALNASQHVFDLNL